MIGSSEMYQALNVSAITTLLSSYTDTPNGKAMFEDNVIPSDVLCVEDVTLNYYPSAPFNGALDYGNYPYYINCRAGTYYASRTLGETTLKEINRKSYGDFFIVASLLGTVEPKDETDNYNTPLSVTLKSKKAVQDS